MPGRSELTAISLLNTLDHRLSRAQINEGRLRLTFDNDIHLEVAPHRQWEAWQIARRLRVLLSVSVRALCGSGAPP